MNHRVATAFVFIISLCLCKHTTASVIEEANSHLSNLVERNSSASLTALNSHLATMTRQDIDQLDNQQLAKAKQVVMDCMPDCFCHLEDIRFTISEDLYRNIILFAAYIRPDLSHQTLNPTIPALDALKGLCALYYRQGNMDDQMTEAFTNIEQHYKIQIGRKTMGELYWNMSFADKLLTPILFGVPYVFVRILTTPMYRNATVSVIACMVIKSKLT